MQLSGLSCCPTGCSWRRERPCEVDHLKPASPIKCHLVESGRAIYYVYIPVEFQPQKRLDLYLLWVEKCKWLQVYLLAQFLEKWEKDDDAKLVIFKVAANNSKIFFSFN